MPFVPAANVAQAEMRMTLAGQQIENVLHFQATGVQSGESLGILGGYLLDWWRESYAPLVTNNVNLREIYLTDLTGPEGASQTVVPSPVANGGIAEDAEPNAVAFCVSFRSAGRGRSSRGRNYISGLSTADVTGNSLSSTRANAAVAAYNALPLAVDPFGDGAYTWVVLSRRHNGVNRVAGVTYPITTATYVDLIVDSQRRRAPGRGR